MVGLALEMLLTGEPIDAQRALAANLVSRVVPHARLMEEAERVAGQILRSATAAGRSEAGSSASPATPPRSPSATR
jgi:enoyl-CoA hydratase/carnithine racemase